MGHVLSLPSHKHWQQGEIEEEKKPSHYPRLSVCPQKLHHLFSSCQFISPQSTWAHKHASACLFFLFPLRHCITGAQMAWAWNWERGRQSAPFASANTEFIKSIKFPVDENIPSFKSWSNYSWSTRQMKKSGETDSPSGILHVWPHSIQEKDKHSLF